MQDSNKTVGSIFPVIYKLFQMRVAWLNRNVGKSVVTWGSGVTRGVWCDTNFKQSCDSLTLAKFELQTEAHEQNWKGSHTIFYFNITIVWKVQLWREINCIVVMPSFSYDSFLINVARELFLNSYDVVHY